MKTAFLVAILVTLTGCTVTRVTHPEMGWELKSVNGMFDRRVANVVIVAVERGRSGTNRVWTAVLEGYSSSAKENIGAASEGIGAIIRAAAGIP